MSHRTHHGHLAAQHTEDAFGTPGIWSLAALLALLALALAGCATTTADCTDLAHGACKVSGTRLLTDSAITLDATDQNGQPLHLGFTSQPNQAGVAAAFAQLGSVVGLLGKLLAAQAAPGQPAPPHVIVPPVVVPTFPKPPTMPDNHE